MESRRGGESHRAFERGSMSEVVHIAWPIVISMLSFTAMGVTDTLLVGWVGTTELAAVGLATTAFFLFNSFFMGTLHGVKVISAQATGAEKPELAVHAGWQGVLLAIPFGMLLIALSAMDDVIFGLMGGPADVRELATVYFGWRVLGSPAWFVVIAAGGYFQGIGDTRTPMKVNVVVNIANVVLDVVLIFGLGPVPAMGVAGAAIATAIACAMGAVVMFAIFVSRVGLHPRPHIGLMVRVLRLGVPIGVRYVLNVAGFTVFTAIIARMGEAALAAHQIAFKIISVSFLPGYGISEAATILTGQYVGAGRPESARASYVNAMKLSASLMGVMGMAFWLFPELLVGVFRDDPEVVRLGSQLLLLAAIFQIFDAVAMTGIGALNGTGDTRFTMLMSIGCSWFVLVPLAYYFGVVANLGAVGAWMGITIEVIVLAGISAWRFNTGAWNKHAVV